MTTMAIPTGPLVQAIGWALLHLVWEGFLIAAILGAALALMRRQSANARYLASCGALLVLVALGVANVYRAYDAGTASVAAGVSPAAGRAMAPAPTQFAVSDFSPLAYINNHLSEIVALWLLGVAILSARLVAGWLGAYRLANRTHAAPADWERSLRRIADALDLKGPIRLLESAAVEVPSVVGWLRPVVLLPVAALSGLSVQQIEMILAHELAHIRRHDFIVNLGQSVLETLLFYHPAVWWISRRIRIEREHCCDDQAVALFGDPLQYAHALTRFEELRAGAQSAVAVSGGSLLSRIRRLVSVRGESSVWSSRWAAGAALLTVLTAFLVAPSLPLFASHQDAPKASSAKAPTAGVNGGVTGGIAGGVKGGVSGGVNTTKCSESSGVVVDVDAPEIEPDDPPAPPAPPAPPSFAIAIPPIAIAPIPMAGPIVHQSVAMAEQIANEVTHDLDLSGIHVMEMPNHHIGENGKLSVDDLLELKSLNVTPQYIASMREAGLGSLSLDDLARLRMAEVTPEYVREMREAGYTRLNVRDLMEMRMQGVTPSFVKSLSEAGYSNLPVRDLLRLRAMGVDGNFIRELSKYRTR